MLVIGKNLLYGIVRFIAFLVQGDQHLGERIHYASLLQVLPELFALEFGRSLRLLKCGNNTIYIDIMPELKKSGIMSV